MAKRFDMRGETWPSEDGHLVSYKDYKELQTAAAELLEYARENQPDEEREGWLGPHPIDVMEKLLK